MARALQHAGHSARFIGLYYHFVMANTNSPYAEFLSVGKAPRFRPIFNLLEGEPLPVTAGFRSIRENPASVSS